jgi:hypothetical protein
MQIREGIINGVFQSLIFALYTPEPLRTALQGPCGDRLKLAFQIFESGRPWVSSMKGSAFQVARFIAGRRAMTAAAMGTSFNAEVAYAPRNPGGQGSQPLSDQRLLPVVGLQLFDKIVANSLV